jgi:hypothetical protein
MCVMFPTAEKHCPWIDYQAWDSTKLNMLLKGLDYRSTVQNLQGLLSNIQEVP